jgi:hypothetical protein
MSARTPAAQVPVGHGLGQPVVGAVHEHGAGLRCDQVNAATPWRAANSFPRAHRVRQCLSGIQRRTRWLQAGRHLGSSGLQDRWARELVLPASTHHAEAATGGSTEPAAGISLRSCCRLAIAQIRSHRAHGTFTRYTTMQGGGANQLARNFLAALRSR